MLLAVDIGNSNIVLGVYDQDKIKFHTRISTDRNTEYAQYAVLFERLLMLHGHERRDIDDVIISSVVPRLTSIISEAVTLLCGCEAYVFGHDLCPEFELDIENPAELGSDLLASSYYVRHNFALPAIIIDAGTATKISAVDETGRFLGVSIAPGMFISLNALVSGTSLLTEIPVTPPKKGAIGKNTHDSIKSGVLLGTAAMLDGMIRRFSEDIKTPVKTIVGTGGAAQYIFPLTEYEVTVRDTLILDGLALAYKNTKS